MCLSCFLSDKRLIFFFQALVVKKTKTSSGPGELNDDGDMTFLLGARKKITMRSKKSNTYVDIREFYEKYVKELPGKKGYW